MLAALQILGRNDPQYTEQTFEVRRADGSVMELKGNWLVVDNGYHKVRFRAAITPKIIPNGLLAPRVI